MISDDEEIHSLRLAVIKALIAELEEGVTRVRADGRPGFDRASHRHPHEVLRLPGDDTGQPLGKVIFYGTNGKVEIFPDEVLAWVRKHDPDSVEQYLEPTVVTRPEVVDLIRVHLPHLLKERVKPKVAEQLAKTATNDRGRLKDPDGNGGVTTVGRVIPPRFGGDVAWKPEDDARDRILAAIRTGMISLPELLGPLHLAITAPATDPPEAVPPGMTITVVPEQVDESPVPGSIMDMDPLFTVEDLQSQHQDRGSSAA